ncbi:MAG TPA: FG-GAP-like repeat-containing protein [Acidimicrobiia bacterium]|nr:FG-GAP-like repeat-containing protein [Acidimicrobiia bacterium]
MPSRRVLFPALVTMLATAGIVAPSVPAGAATQPSVRFQRSISNAWFAWSSPAIADVNSDGQNDIVVGGQDGGLYAYDAAGNRLWRGAATGAIASSPAVGDLDADGKNEVVVGTGSLDVPNSVGALDIFDGNGALRCQKLMGTTKEGSAVYGAPAIGDVNGDHQNDVVFGSFDHNVYVLDGHCNELARFDNRDSIFSTPALYDTDGDGQMEIFIGGDATRNDAVPESFAGGAFRALRYQGTPLLKELWQKRSTETFQSGAAIGDIDGDGRLEVVTGAGAYYCRFKNICADSNKVWAFHLDDGSSPAGWPKAATLNTTFNAAPALGDLDGDGIADVVIGTNQYTGGNPTAGALNAFYSRDGSRKSYTASGDVQLIGSPIIADLDGRAGNEVVVAHSGRVFFLSSSLIPTGTEINDPPLSHEAAAAVGELGKGNWSVVNTGFDGNKTGWVQAHAIPAPTSTPWPMLSKNSRHLGTDVAAVVPIECNSGYRLVAADGGVFAFGDAKYYGSTGAIRLAQPIVGSAPTTAGDGYWFVARDGGIFAFGNAKFFGSTGNIRLAQPVVGMAPTPSGKGYWLVASDGGIFSYGDAAFYGSTGNIKLNSPIVGMAAAPSGKGYWLVAADGGIFNYGDAAFYGSTGNIRLAQPIVGMARTSSGKGYWFVASDGGIFSFGDAKFFGSAGSLKLARPVVGMQVDKSGGGYWFVASDGGIFNYGAAEFCGSTGRIKLNSPIVSIS